MSVSIEEKDGCLIVSSVPAAGKNYCLLPLSNPRTARTDNRKSFLCRCLKNEKTAFLSSNKKAVFCCFCSFGGWTSTVGRFWKTGPKKPGNPHEYWKKSGWHLFRHPFLVRATGLEPVRHKHTPLKRACLPVPARSHFSQRQLLYHFRYTLSIIFQS